jgi:hypothetical protein
VNLSLPLTLAVSRLVRLTTAPELALCRLSSFQWTGKRAFRLLLCLHVTLTSPLVCCFLEVSPQTIVLELYSPSYVIR